MMNLRKTTLAMALAVSAMTLTACDSAGVSVGGSVYYDSMLWNDYYHGHPGYRPDRPGRPKPPGIYPPRPHPPSVRPPIARPPIHRPSPRLR